MKIFYTSISIIVISLLFLFCQDNKSVDNIYESQEKLNYKLEIIDTLIVDGNFNLGAVKALVFWNNDYIISDNITNKIWVLDSNLSVKREMGGKGRGPGEFISSPNIAYDSSTIDFIDYRGKKIYTYDKNYTLIKTNNFNREMIIHSFSWVKTKDRYILCGSKPDPKKKMDELGSVLILDSNLNYIDNILDWDDIYHEMTAGAVYNMIVKLTGGKKGYFFAQQTAVPNKVFCFDLQGKLEKRFGRLPKYYKKPPEIPVEKVMASVEATAKFVANITRVKNMCYDKKTDRLFINYVNLFESASYLRSGLEGEHYLQIYNSDYDLIFDESIPGSLLFVKDKKIYI
ncbi:MAG: hypothetical protein CR986_02275 [Ignavibacteriae bacterium]|nr:MAG: hypothetical protein CR986_02275 [Ignavibacteriota bacterium]